MVQLIGRNRFGNTLQAGMSGFVKSNNNIEYLLVAKTNLVGSEEHPGGIADISWELLNGDGNGKQSTLPESGNGTWEFTNDSTGTFTLSGKTYECPVKGLFTKIEKKEIEWISGEVEPGAPNYEVLQRKTERTGSYGTINITAPEQLGRNLGSWR